MKIQDNNIIRDATPEEEAENASKHQQFLDEKQAREQINKLKSHHDYIIIDTPPNFQTAALKAALLNVKYDLQ